MTSQNELALTTATALVPAGYAEKAMASLMQLHSELMDEKEKRVELFRCLMEKEQALAELKMYVKLLEEKAVAAVAPAPREPLRVAARPSIPSSPPFVPFVARTRTEAATRHSVSVTSGADLRPRTDAAVRSVDGTSKSRSVATRAVDGWKTW